MSFDNYYAYPHMSEDNMREHLYNFYTEKKRTGGEDVIKEWYRTQDIELKIKLIKEIDEYGQINRYNDDKRISLDDTNYHLQILELPELEDSESFKNKTTYQYLESQEKLNLISHLSYIPKTWDEVQLDRKMRKYPYETYW